MNRILLALTVLATASAVAAADKKIVFLAGGASHGGGDHEHRAGCLLFQSCLKRVPGVVSEVHSNGWPANPEAAFAGAATVVIYSDGGGGHPFLSDNHLQTVGELMKKGVGLACLHYAVEPTKEAGEKEFLDWIGGCFEQHWSVNPTWRPEFQPLPAHAITRGVKPFSLTDEWYFHMRFREGMDRVVPILAAVAPASTMNRPDGPHSGNPAVRAAVKRGEPQILAWARIRPDGGRGFGFTGGHFHRNWGNDDCRKLVLNAILWTAKVEVPAGGVECKVAAEDLLQNLDRK
jgi:type 1 glutamine amidotransferase